MPNTARFRTAPFRQVRFGPRDVESRRQSDGTIRLRSPNALGPYPDKLTERLVHWARVAPDRTFVAQRARDGTWQRVSYAQTLDRVRRIGAALLARELSPERPIAILSENSIEHLMLALAAQHVGVPHAPIAPAYSLMSGDYARLRHVLDLLTPGLTFAQSGERFGSALRNVVPDACEVVVVEGEVEGRNSSLFADLAATAPDSAVDSAFARVGPDTIAKILFTSGSTAMPKGVINTQRMLCANQQQILQCFPFLGDEPPAIVDWLVWNHTFGGNHNVGMMLYNGGSLYIDDGRPVPGGIEKTVANLREIAPTVYFNVPKGFEELIPYLRRDPALRERFFSRLSMLFYAGAGLPQHVWDALEELAVATLGERIVITTGLGSTESAPSALFANWSGGFSGLLGVPVSGLEVKLVPSEDKLEARYRGPNVTPGYWRAPEITAASFDDEGFWLTGDALRFVDAARPEAGMLFDGRIAEDFKLRTGTWVSVGALRASLIAACEPLLHDAVIAGHDCEYVSAILFANVEACRGLCSHLDPNAPYEIVVSQPVVAQRLQDALTRLAARSTGSATRVARAVLADTPPSPHKGEVTDKGSLNQRAVLRERASLVAELYGETSPPHVLVVVGKRS